MKQNEIDIAVRIATQAIGTEDDDTMGLDADDIDHVSKALIELHERTVAALKWMEGRLEACRKTQVHNPSAQSRDWAYGESVALKAVRLFLNGEADKVPE